MRLLRSPRILAPDFACGTTVLRHACEKGSHLTVVENLRPKSRDQWTQTFGCNHGRINRNPSGLPMNALPVQQMGIMDWLVTCKSLKKRLSLRNIGRLLLFPPDVTGTSSISAARETLVASPFNRAVRSSHGGVEHRIRVPFMCSAGRFCASEHQWIGDDSLCGAARRYVIYRCSAVPA